MNYIDAILARQDERFRALLRGERVSARSDREESAAAERQAAPENPASADRREWEERPEAVSDRSLRRASNFEEGGADGKVLPAEERTAGRKRESAGITAEWQGLQAAGWSIAVRPQVQTDPAQALSRLLERDARRYDGGFSLY